MSQHQNDLIGRFAQHSVAANLLMVIMLMSGVWALSKLNTQFFPNFALDFIIVNVPWSGASAEDVETSITRPIEQTLRHLDQVKKMTSTSANGIASITLEYDEGADMGIALDQVNEKIALLRSLPSTAKKPEISKVQRYELLARLLLFGTDDVDELRHLAYKIEQDLLKAGIDKVSFLGIPKQEMAIQLSSQKLDALGLDFQDVAQAISASSRDIPAGLVGREDVARQLRSLEQRRNALAFADIPLASEKGRLLTLGDVADISQRQRTDETLISYQGRPAIELDVFRAEHRDALTAARKMNAYLAQVRPSLPPNIQLVLYDQTWKYINDRIMLLLKNGAGGLILVVLILYIFLNGRVAFWVALGIPVSLMAAQAALYAFGGSINMVSLFAMIMTLGIIVDDAIVVGEDALALYQKGEGALESAKGGAHRMLAPVMASSLTTIAAFFPLMLIGGIMGNILFAIPLVIVCVIIASLIESFLILPGHLRHSFEAMRHDKPSKFRLKLDNAFEYFKEKQFRPLITLALNWRWVLLSIVFSLFLLGIALLKSDRINFTFFPSPEASMIMANVSFVAGTPPDRVDAFLVHLDKRLHVTAQDLSPDKSILVAAVTRHKRSSTAGSQRARTGSQFGSILLELTPSDQRDVRTNVFIKTWHDSINIPAGLESLTIVPRKGGPPGRDIDIRLSGDDTQILKAAALSLNATLQTFKGVSAIEDDMPYGREQLIYTLKPEAIALGLRVSNVGQQLRAAFDGQLVQIYLDGRDEIEVRVQLADVERNSLSALANLTLKLPNGKRIALHNAVNFESRRGFEIVRHLQGALSVQVSADVDKEQNNANRIIATLSKTGGVLEQLEQRYGISYSYEGRAADQKQTLSDMLKGLVFALALIYLVLAWVFGSYGWPIVVMIAIPFGLIGALAGHWILDINLTILSLFGFFGLSGIVINDSIVLVTFYRQLREESRMSIQNALVEAACQRLRAVLLTSLTTIAGLLPLLFETSLQAQFLIPMAVSIVFGLAFATVLILLLVPALLSIYEDLVVKE